MIDAVSLLILFLVLNLSILVLVWQVYGARIQVMIARKAEKDQVLEQLRMEALDLKLPKEHSPRI